MDVHLKAVYILARKERGGIGDDSRIVCAHQLFHIWQM